VLIWMAIRAIRGSRVDRPFAVAFIFWAVAQMFYANLRVVAVPFAFGLAFLTIRAMGRDEPPDSDDAEPAVDGGPVRRVPVAAGAAYGADNVGLVTPARTSSPVPLRVACRSSCDDGRHVALVTADGRIVPADQ
jgi:hypothetical protein